MTPTDGYRQRVAPATSRLNELQAHLISQLDVDEGGFGWWSGYLDWRTRIMLSDYLIQSIAGTAESLVLASLSAQDHAQDVHAENYAIKAIWSALDKQRSPSKPTPTDYLAAIPRDAHAERRSHRITASAEHCLFHLGQTLDRMAAAILIVGAIARHDVMSCDWGDIIKLQEADWAKLASTTQTSGRKQRPARGPLDVALVGLEGTPGGDMQRALIAATTHKGHGPDGWLPWLRETRNAMTHRSPAVKMQLMVDGRNMIRVFYRNPKWSEVQSFVFAERAGTARSRRFELAMRDQFIVRSSSDVLDGLCESMTSFVTAVVGALTHCWDERRSHPEWLVQHAAQWPLALPRSTSAEFTGYGTEPRVHADTMAAAHPSGTRRWAAARIMDDRWRDWEQ
ncbi:hypothetical protein [Gordonia jacobaea]|uniref:hypothetical protein n=1 Tax=Gordonia jacobaea TaxID=122202 RepID=UPI003D72CEA7